MSYSNGILGWGSGTTSEKIVEQPEPVFLFTGDLISDNARNFKFASNQENAVMSDSSHFSIINNEIVVNKTGIYKIHFTNNYVNNLTRSSVYFRSTNLEDGKQTNNKIITMNSTYHHWTLISLFIVIKLTAGVERHTIFLR